MDGPYNIMIKHVRTRPFFKDFNIIIGCIGSQQIIIVVILFCDTSKSIKNMTGCSSLERVCLEVLYLGTGGNAFGVVEINVIMIHVLVFSFDDHVNGHVITDCCGKHSSFKLVHCADSLHGIKKILGNKTWGFTRTKNNSCPNYHESSKTTRSLAPRK